MWHSPIHVQMQRARNIHTSWKKRAFSMCVTLLVKLLLLFLLGLYFSGVNELNCSMLALSLSCCSVGKGTGRKGMSLFREGTWQRRENPLFVREREICWQKRVCAQFFGTFLFACLCCRISSHHQHFWEQFLFWIDPESEKLRGKFNYWILGKKNLCVLRLGNTSWLIIVSSTFR